MPSKKKSEPKILSVIPAVGSWVAVHEEDNNNNRALGLNVAAWAVTTQGVMGLVANLDWRADPVLVLVSETCLGYVKREGQETADFAAGRYLDSLPEEDEEDDDSDETD